MSGVAALEVTNVTKAFGGLTAVGGVSLTIAAGERRALIGPNGAGKTTLFNVIAGDLAPTSGRILLFGQDVTRLPAHRRAALGLARTFQITTLFPSLTVLDNLLLATHALDRSKLVAFRPRNRYVEMQARARAMLAPVGLDGKDDEVVRSLSHGEQRQLEVAMALCGRPRLLLLDEPTAGLSPAESPMMSALLRKLDPAITILIIEHDMDVAFGLTDRVTVLHNGQVVADGTSDAVRGDPLVAEIYLGSG
jgi:branched-chain amino acid transport system ATP-binding protein